MKYNIYKLFPDNEIYYKLDSYTYNKRIYNYIDSNDFELVKVFSHTDKLETYKLYSGLSTNYKIIKESVIIMHESIFANILNYINIKHEIKKINDDTSELFKKSQVYKKAIQVKLNIIHSNNNQNYDIFNLTKNFVNTYIGSDDVSFVDIFTYIVDYFVSNLDFDSLSKDYNISEAKSKFNLFNDDFVIKFKELIAIKLRLHIYEIQNTILNDNQIFQSKDIPIDKILKLSDHILVYLQTLELGTINLNLDQQFNNLISIDLTTLSNLYDSYCNIFNGTKDASRSTKVWHEDVDTAVVFKIIMKCLRYKQEWKRELLFIMKSLFSIVLHILNKQKK